MSSGTAIDDPILGLFSSDSEFNNTTTNIGASTGFQFNPYGVLTQSLVAAIGGYQATDATNLSDVKVLFD